jgi:uncharacterized protein involved in outer membrane biogenesis
MQNDEMDLSNATDGRDLSPKPDAPGLESKAPSPRRRWRWLFAALVLAVVGLAYALFDWNLFKGYAERRVSAATGREFHIDGNLDIRLSMQPLVTMDGLRLGNVKGAAQPTMASAQRLQFRVELWPLLNGQTILPEVHLTKPSMLLERYRDGGDNWTLPSSGSNPVIRQFTVDHGELRYVEDAKRTDLVIDVDSDKPGPSRLAPLNFQGKGTYRNNPFTLAGRADSPLDLANTQTPYRIDIGASAGATRAHASGALNHPLQLSGFRLDFTLAGPDLAQLYRLLGIAMPETPPYRLHGTLGHMGHVWSFDHFTGTVGKSDLAGDVRIDNTGTRKRLTTKLASRNLDVHDLAGFVGAPAHADPRKASTPQQQAEALQAEATDRLLPQKPYDLEHLRSMDADVELRARHVVGTPVPLDDLLARMTIDQGVVHLDPFDFGAAGGKVGSTIVLDASKPVIATSAKIKARGIDFAQLVPNVPAIQRSAGRIGASLDLRGTGNSIAKMFATSNGRATVGMGGGKVSDLFMAYAALNIARILKLKIVGDHDVAIRCLVGDFAAKDGVWTASTLVFDSSDTVILGTGDLDMRDEQLDLVLKVKPKGSSMLSLRSPLHVDGALKHPDIRPDYKVIGLRGAAVVVLASIALPAAELGLIDVGRGKDSECLKWEVSAR